MDDLTIDGEQYKDRNSKKRGVCIDCSGPTTCSQAKRCAPCSYKHRRAYASRYEYVRNWQLQKKYGITLEEFEAWWIVFRGRCGICNTELKLPEKKRGQPLDVVAVDHDHKTGQIRGLLCNACNKGIGLFYENPIFLANAVKWVTMNEKTSDNT